MVNKILGFILISPLLIFILCGMVYSAINNFDVFIEEIKIILICLFLAITFVTGMILLTGAISW